MENPVDVAQKEAQNGIRRGRAKALLLFAAGEREGGIIGGIGRECYTQDVSMLCVCNYTRESTGRGRESFHARGEK